MAEDFLSQLTNLVSGIQQGQKQWDYGKYSGPAPRYEQELTNLTTKWQSVFNYLDVDDSSGISNAYKELEGDFNDYSRMYPQELFRANNIKKEITEMLDVYNTRSKSVSAAQIELGQLRTRLEGFSDSDVVGNMLHTYMTENPDKDQKDFRQQLAVDISDMEKKIVDIQHGIFFTTDQEKESPGLHKIKQNEFFNNNLLAIEGFDDITRDISSAGQYIHLFKNEMSNGFDAMLEFDKHGEPWVAANQNESGETPYTLQWHINDRESQDLKNVLNGVVDSTNYKNEEALVIKQKNAHKQSALLNQESNVKTYKQISYIKEVAEFDTGKDWENIESDPDAFFTLLRPDAGGNVRLPYKINELQGRFTKDMFGGNYNMIPEDLRKRLEAQLRHSPNSDIQLYVAEIQLLENLNMQNIQNEDLRFLDNWNDIEGEHPLPIEIKKPNLYPPSLLNLLKSDDVQWGRAGGRYGQYGLLDYGVLHEQSGLFFEEEVDALNVGSIDASATNIVQEDGAIDDGTVTEGTDGSIVEDTISGDDEGIEITDDKDKDTKKFVFEDLKYLYPDRYESSILPVKQNIDNLNNQIETLTFTQYGFKAGDEYIGEKARSAGARGGNKKWASHIRYAAGISDGSLINVSNPKIQALIQKVLRFRDLVEKRDNLYKKFTRGELAKKLNFALHGSTNISSKKELEEYKKLEKEIDSIHLPNYDEGISQFVDTYLGILGERDNEQAKLEKIIGTENYQRLFSK